MVQLQVYSGKHAGTSTLARRFPFVVGRNSTSDLCLEREGIWDRVLHTLHQRVRQREGREAHPSAAIIDSQSIKTSAVRGPEKGYDAGKKNRQGKRGVGAAAAQRSSREAR